MDSFSILNHAEAVVTKTTEVIVIPFTKWHFQVAIVLNSSSCAMNIIFNLD